MMNQVGVTYCASCGSLLSPQSNGTWQGGRQAYAYRRTPEIVAAESDAVGSLIMGIIGIVAAYFLAGLVTGPLAISRGRRARTVLSEQNHNYWIALAGVITGAIGLALSAIVAIIWIAVIVSAVTAYSSY